MLVLELFAGTRSISNAFESAGHTTYAVDWDSRFERIDLCADILTVTKDFIIENVGLPDVLWASFDCTSFSIAAISHHRIKNPITGNLDPKSDYAKKCDEVDQHCLQLIGQLQAEREKRGLPPMLYFIENPVGGLRKMTWMNGYPRHTVTYCQYELDKPVDQRRKKPTDIFTNHPDPKFKPMCKNGAPCHAAAPRGSRTGTQGMKNAKERSTIPRALCEHIVHICEEYYHGC